MLQRIKLLSLAILLISLFLPSLILAVANIYHTCPSSHPYFEKGLCRTEKGAVIGLSSISVCYEGLIPCGLGKSIWIKANVKKGKCDGGTHRPQGTSCQFCHFFVMINNIVTFFLIHIIPYVAILMICIGGLFFYFGGVNPNSFKLGKQLLIGVVIGLILIYGAYIFVNSFLNILGITEIHWGESGPFSINCLITI